MDTLPKNGTKNLFSYHSVRKSIFLLYTKFIKPRSHHEDISRQEAIINIILSSLLFITLILQISLIYNIISRGSNYTGISLITFSSLPLIFAALLLLSRKGYIKIAIYSLLLICFIFTTYVEYHWGMSSPAGLLGYALIITMASILVSGNLGIITSVLTSITIIYLAYVESKTGIIASWKKEPTLFSTGIQYSFILLSITTLSWLSAREIKKSLLRARASEQALREKNESLEVIVEERTRELRQAQIEKMSQLYRFVEFGRLSSGIFHDLLNPLSVVTSHVEVLQSSHHNTIPEIKEHIERASLASKRMEQFISSVTKQVQSHHEEHLFSLNKEIEESLLLFEYSARKHHIQIEFYADKEIYLFGNPIKFHQIISNLISNAIDALENSEQLLKQITITLSETTDTTQIKISDTGSGIPSHIIPNIFDPFFSTKHEHKGIGLGLSTTKHIIEKDFKGAITVESTPEHGTTFNITLPYEKNSPTK